MRDPLKIDTTSYTIALCYGAMMCLAICVNLPPVFLTTFSETFGGQGGLTGEQLGRIPATIFTAMIFGIVVTGPLADRWGVRLFAMTGLGCISLGLGVLGCATNYTVLLLAAGFLGLGTANLEVVLSPIVAAARPRQRASALNRLHFFYSAGAVGTVLIGSAALHLAISWRIICFAIALFPVLIMLGFTRIEIPSLLHEKEEKVPLLDLLRHPYLLAASLAICLGGATEIGLAQWLPAYAERSLGYSKAASGVSLAGFSVAMGVGRIVVARFAHRTGILPIMMGCCLACVVLIAAGCFSPSVPVALASCVLAGLSVSCLWPSSLAVAADRFPRGGASLFAIMAAAGNAGCVIMPWFVGLMSERTNIRDGILSIAVCPTALILVLLWMAYSTKRTPTD